MIPVRGFEGQTVAVFGLGRSGLTAARALVAGGARVAVWDDNAASRSTASKEGLEPVDLNTADWSGFAALMLSPGVPLTHPEPHWVVAKARAAGVEILGDVELFARTINLLPEDQRPKVIAITGTNGKSTTTALVDHICRTAGRDSRIGGNFGIGILGLEPPHSGAVYVLELSSYQLDLTSSLKADVALILNISEDHLERHGGMAGYVAAKRRILLNQGKGDTAVIGVDDPLCGQICTEITATNKRTIRPISSGRAMGRGVYALSGMLYDATGDRVEEILSLEGHPALTGRHNWQNAAAAYACARGIGLSRIDAIEGLKTFPGLAHRMETVREIGRVRFVNDSKATNADAARQAMSSYPSFRWIAGGRAKTGGIDSLGDLFGRVKKAYLIGESAEAFATTLNGACEIELCETIDNAVASAWRDASSHSGPEVILLSPACASFDQFPDFEVRGDAFRSAVESLKASV
jgi:UDP-N-acetylmuramoylalanine--D-glutamate ligase